MTMLGANMVVGSGSLHMSLLGHTLQKKFRTSTCAPQGRSRRRSTCAAPLRESKPTKAVARDTSSISTSTSAALRSKTVVAHSTTSGRGQEPETQLEAIARSIGERILTDDEKKDLLINQVVVSTFVIGSLFKLGTVDIGMEYAKNWTLWQYVLHLPKDNLTAYLGAVAANPVLTKAFTSGVAYGAGDFLSQFVQGRKLEDVRLSRVARSAAAGFMIHGPFCHYWILFTENNLGFDGAWFSTPVKVIADQTVWSIFLNTMYTTTILALQGKKPAMIKEEIDATWFLAIKAGWKFWPLIHMVTFSSLIPHDLKLLFVDCVEVIWVMILSQTVNRDANSGEQPEKLQCVIEDFASPSTGVVMTHEMESQVCIEENGEMVCFVPDQDACLLSPPEERAEKAPK